MVLLLPAAGFGDSHTMGWGGKGKGLNQGFLQQLSHLLAGQSDAEWFATQAFFRNISPGKGKGKGKGQDTQGHRGKGVHVQPAVGHIPDALEEEGWSRPKLAPPVVMGLNGKVDTMTHPYSGQTVNTVFLCHLCSCKHCSNNRSHCANINCGVKRNRAKEPSTVPKKGTNPQGQPGLGGKGGRVNPTVVVIKKPPKAPGHRTVQLAEAPAAMETDQPASEEVSPYICPVLLKPGNLRSCVLANIEYALEVDTSQGPASGSPDNGPQRAAQLVLAQNRLNRLQEDDPPEWKEATLAEIASLQEAEPPSEVQELHNLAACAMIQATHLKDMGIAAAAFQKMEASILDEIALIKTRMADLQAARLKQVSVDTRFAAQLLFKCGTKVVGPVNEPEAKEAVPSPEVMEHLFTVIKPEMVKLASSMAMLPENVTQVLNTLQTLCANLHRGVLTEGDVTMEGPNGIDIPAGASNGD